MHAVEGRHNGVGVEVDDAVEVGLVLEGVEGVGDAVGEGSPAVGLVGSENGGGPADELDEMDDEH